MNKWLVIEWILKLVFIYACFCAMMYGVFATSKNDVVGIKNKVYMILFIFIPSILIALQFIRRQCEKNRVLLFIPERRDKNKVHYDWQDEFAKPLLYIE